MPPKQKRLVPDERALREELLLPLFQRMGYRDVRVTHGGALEQGKDLVMWLPDLTRDRTNYAVVAKATSISGQASGRGTAAEVYTQIKQCLGDPYRDPATLEERRVDRVLVVSTGTIRTEAQHSLNSLLESDGVLRLIDFVDGDKLAAWVEQYLGERLILDQLGEVARKLDALSPDYRVVAQTGGDGIALTIEPKDPQAANREPADFKMMLAFPDTAEGRSLQEALHRHLLTGHPVQIPGAYVRDFQPPGFLKGLLDLKSVGELSFGPRVGAHNFLVDIEASVEGRESAVLRHVELRSIRAGTEEIVFSNVHQARPWHVEMTLHRMEAPVFTVHFNFRGVNVREHLAGLTFADALSSEPELILRGSRTKVVYVRGRLPAGLAAPPPKEVLKFLSMLVDIQDRVGVPLSLPNGELEEADFVLVAETHQKVMQGGFEERPRELSLTLSRAAAEEALLESAKGPIGVLRIAATEELDLFGSKIDLGQAEYQFFNPLLAEPDRLAVIRALEDPSQENVPVRFSPGENARVVATFPKWLPAAQTPPSPDGEPSDSQSPQSKERIGMASELDLLNVDLGEVWGFLQEPKSPLSSLGDLTDKDLQNYRHMVTDLALRVLSHASGIAALVPANLREPAMVTARAMYEALTILGYLVQHPRCHEEAVIYLAASYLRQLERHASDPTLCTEWSACLGRMPAHLVDEARQRLSRKPWTWSGVTIATMANAAKMRRHEVVFDFLSAEAHGSIAGERIVLRQVTETERQLSLNLGLRGSEPEALANMARRALKAAMVWLWEAVDGPKVVLPTSDPDLWEAPV